MALMGDNDQINIKRSDFHDRLYKPRSPVLLFDGAMGTSLQGFDLTAEDFGGTKLEGCNENLVRTRPEIVKAVHDSFLKSGADVIETNTFGATSVVLAEYGLENYTHEINLLAASIAKEAANDFSTNDHPRFVAGSIGPTTKLPSLGHIDFDRLKASYKDQVSSLIEGGVDLLTIETCQDVLQIKAVLQASEEVFNEVDKRVPIMVSVTIETTGTMLLGTDIAAVVSILEPFNIDILGLNCATGPVQMRSHIKYLSQYSPFTISCVPNAGLPENIGGIAHYKLTPLELKMEMMHFVEDLGVKVIGGCCGTTPSHISTLNDLKSDLIPADRTIRKSTNEKRLKINYDPSAASIYSTVNYKQDNSFLIVGERLNASGSKKARDLLNEENWDGLVSLARDQQREQAHILDINVDYVGRDGIRDMKELVARLVTNVNLPLMLDSTDWQKMESGLKVSGGKSILNSTNYEDGNDRFFRVLELAKSYGAGIVIGTIDEDGMARTAEKKYQIARRAYIDAIKFGIPPHELFYDPLALPISTGIEEDRRNGLETIKAIKKIREELEDVHIILGVSNVSFGLSPSARITLNSVFLHECYSAGLDSAIISPSKILPLVKINNQHKTICKDLINDNRRFEKNVCIYDPLTELTSVFEGVTTKQARLSGPKLCDLEVEDRLKKHIVDGERIGLEESLTEALKKYKPLDIINKYLLDGMKVVGELFGSGQMQLPFVLQSAQTMKASVSFLEPFMDKSQGASSSKGKFLIATVKGDVHDIGKNLVDIILSNNGYEVINLGIKQDVQSIIKAQEQHKADCIAMSGLLVKSTAFMKDNLEAFNTNSITVPVILGGAALTPRFVAKDCGGTYNGLVVYGKDAFADLKFMDALMKAKRNDTWDDRKGFLETPPENIIFGQKNPNQSTESILDTNKLTILAKDNTIKKANYSTKRSVSIPNEDPIKPPFLGVKYLNENDIQFDELLHYLDKNALFAGQWQMRKSREQTRAEYEDFLEENAVPILNKLIKKIKNESLLSPSVAYGYFNCGRKDNSLLVYDTDKSICLGTFSFPRQRSGQKLCISDYFCDLNSNEPIDYLPMQAVTVGKEATEYSQLLYKNNEYTEYLYFHGLSVQLAEALAEWTHARIRKECGFSKDEPNLIKDVLAQRYRGCRYSFGYPACPNVADSGLQLEWMKTQKIGIYIDESDQLFPEQSTTAIVALHSKAKYFSAMSE